MRTSKTGVTRNGKRGGNVARLNEVSRAYRVPVAQAMRQYDGHNGVQAVVMFARLKSDGDVLAHDGKHNALVAELTSEPLPSF